MRISDWSSDVCSSDLVEGVPVHDLEPVLLQRLDVCRADQVIAVDGSGAQRVGTSLRLLDRHDHGLGDLGQIGRASCRERVCQYVWISVVAVSLKKKKKTKETNNHSYST